MTHLAPRTLKLAALYRRPHSVRGSYTYLQVQLLHSSSVARQSLKLIPSSNRFTRLSLRQPQSYRLCSTFSSQSRADIHNTAMNASQGREVLPTNVKPVHYDLTLEPNFKDFTYEGIVAIEYVLTANRGCSPLSAEGALIQVSMSLTCLC